jgi:hypothetical protein
VVLFAPLSRLAAPQVGALLLHWLLLHEGNDGAIPCAAGVSRSACWLVLPRGFATGSSIQCCCCVVALSSQPPV